MKNIPLAKDYGKEGKRCAGHPYPECDLEYANHYGFLNVWFGGQGSLYTTEETFNAGHWYELPKGKTTIKEDVESLNKVMKERNTHFEKCFFKDEQHIFVI